MHKKKGFATMEKMVVVFDNYCMVKIKQQKENNYVW